MLNVGVLWTACVKCRCVVDSLCQMSVCCGRPVSNVGVLWTACVKCRCVVDGLCQMSVCCG